MSIHNTNFSANAHLYDRVTISAPTHPYLQPFVNFGGIPANFRGHFVAPFMENYFDIIVYTQVAYLILIWYGPKWMAGRPPMRLRGVSILWNLLLCLFSFGGAIGCVTLLAALWEREGLYGSVCVYPYHTLFDGELSFWMLAFLLSKIPEMIDTVLLVLQKKPLIFLHWYHHLTVSVFCWYAGRSLIASGVYFATMNYCVHAVMYSYYLCCSLRLRWLVRPLAPLITAAQLLQMVVGTAVVGYTWYHSYLSGRGCEVDRRTIRMGVGMYGSYVVLFALLFGRLYLSKGKGENKKKQQQQQAQNGRENGRETVNTSVGKANLKKQK